MLEFSDILVLLQFAWVCISPQLSWIMQSSSVPFPGCQGSCGIVLVTGKVISLNIPTSGLEVSACSVDNDLKYMATMVQLYPSLNHQIKFRQLLGDDAATFWVYSHGQIGNSSSAVSWTQGSLLNYPAKYINC